MRRLPPRASRAMAAAGASGEESLSHPREAAEEAAEEAAKEGYQSLPWEERRAELPREERRAKEGFRLLLWEERRAQLPWEVRRMMWRRKQAGGHRWDAISWWRWLRGLATRHQKKSLDSTNVWCVCKRQLQVQME